MNFVTQYLEKNSFVPRIETKSHEKLGIVIVIPCFYEPCITNTLESLWKCARPECITEIIIVINQPENAPEHITRQNHQTLTETNKWIKNHPDEKLHFYPLFISNFPKKHAGVGLARKTGMDEAIYRFNIINNPEGIIVGFDADSICTPNYLTEIEKHFETHKKTPGASIYFEHPLFTDSTLTIQNRGIILYELHLRYLNQGFRFTMHPHAFQTVGSSFAVRVNACVKQGGMNKRQAGEDFYFLQKIIALGNYTEIQSTCVIPSSRESDRVPFGTGAAIKKWQLSNNHIYYSYSIEAFSAMKSLFMKLEKLFNSSTSEYSEIISDLPPSLLTYLESINYINEIHLIKNNTSTFDSFRNRFFNWFTIFKCIKYLNISHENYYSMQDVTEMAKVLLNKLEVNYRKEITEFDLLILYRSIERSRSIGKIGGYDKEVRE